MYGIGISAPTYDLQGHRYIEGRELLTEVSLGNASLSRRVTRTATLDGGCEIVDGGYSVSDRTLTIECPGASQALVDFLDYITRTYSLIRVCSKEGAFEGAPERLTMKNGTTPSLTILITDTI